ncbi:unnamed protein product [Gadus morhua 'NCC']
MQMWYQGIQQNKINCWEKEKETETENLFSYWRSVRRWAARTEEHSCGGRLSDPLPSASPEPMPSCAESVTKQASRNTGQALVNLSVECCNYICAVQTPPDETEMKTRHLITARERG